MSKPSNPLAFPGAPIEDKLGYMVEGPSGMTLRDYFAGQALPAMVEVIAAGQHSRPPEITGDDWVAISAYHVADSMLKAREQ